MSGLTIHNLSKSFGKTIALEDVSLQVQVGEIIAVLGPSGCGKSTLLNIIAGLDTADQGILFWDGNNLAKIPTHLRGFGLMFQDYALFPHRNVFSNVAFGLQMTAMPSDQIKERVSEVLALVGLPGFEQRDVNTLSGGEQQRVALARSIAPRPSLLMLDEPLGSLDRNMREQLVLDLRRILRECDQTAIYVTHDQEEAFALADRIVIMRNGRIEQTGTPQSIYRQPSNMFVARFLGFTNILSGIINSEQNGLVAATAIGNIPMRQGKPGKVALLLRPDSIYLSNKGTMQLSGTVQDISFRGGICRATILVKEIPLTFDFSSNMDLPGLKEQITMSFDPYEAIQILEIEQNTP